jgi:hypothetical protein
MIDIKNREEQIIEKEEWFHWDILQGHEKLYFINDIIDIGFELTIFLFDNEVKNTIKLHFKQGIFAYRYANESYRGFLFGYLSEYYPDDFYGKRTCFEVRNSHYIRWYLEQVPFKESPANLRHFSLFGFDEVVDIIVSYEPEVIFIEEDTTCKNNG